MRYLGGKARIAKKIAAKILEIVPPEHRLEYLEPFLGGANVFEHIAPYFEKTYAGDVHEDLILMWQAVARGWVPPEVVTEEEYQALKKAAPSALRGWAGFGCSFGGKWMGGYARYSGDRAKYTGRGAATFRPTAAAIRRATCIARVSFFDWPVRPGVVLYCDPPYAGTTGYDETAVFDSDVFWSQAQRWADAGSYVFVSEYSGPPTGWEAFAIPRKLLLHGKTKGEEQLFFKGPQRWAEDKAA